MKMADVVELCVWQQIGGQALVAKRRHRHCALEMPVAGIGCATRKDSLPLAWEIWPGGGSGGGLVCRCPGASRHGIQESRRHETVGKEIFCAP